MIIKPNVPNPCGEDWSKMKIGLNSRFCENCSKNVKDFTTMRRPEILAYLFSNHDKQICGRFKNSQLDFTHTELMVTIQALSKNPKNSNMAFYLLTVGALLLSGCGEETKNENHKSTLSVAFDKDPDTVDTKCNEITGIIAPPPEELPVLGEPAVMTGPSASDPYVEKSFTTREDSINKIYYVVETMPEFYGGMDSLTAFINKNITYPEWEKKNKIQGTVYVTFVLDKSGKPRDAKIIKSVMDSKNFDKEVLRVVDMMPAWKPGKHNNREVNVRFNLPIRFKL